MLKLVRKDQARKFVTAIANGRGTFNGASYHMAKINIPASEWNDFLEVLTQIVMASAVYTRFESEANKFDKSAGIEQCE